MRSEAPALARIIDTLVHHSELLVDIAGGTEVDPALAIVLLQHFAEEHEWLAEDLGGPGQGEAVAGESATAGGSPVGPRGNSPTVGSLLASS